ncbi:MAG TPA: phage major capsid protein, partial [Kribbellaceae bacterium]|nr:phage major capsid protein [Kribbellaceae bacterium]
EEQGTWDSLNEELDNLDKRIKSALDTEQRAKEADDAFNKLESKPQQRGRNAGQDSQQATELRAFMRGDPGAPRAYEVRPDGAVPADFRTLSKLTTGAGGNVVPTSFYNRLMAHLIEVSAILRSGATVLNTSSGETLQVPKTTGHSTALLTAEAGTISASDPAFGMASLGAYKYGVLIQVSRELIDDSGVDLEGYLAMQAGRSLGNALGADLVTGNGSGKPTGILNNSTLGATGPTGVSGGLGPTSATANSGGDLLWDLFYSVIAPYRESSAATWIVRDATMAVLRKIKDTTGQYMFQPSLIAGTPDTLAGKPILTDPFVPAIATGAKAIIFGDMSQYFVRMVGGVRFERSDDFAFNTDLVTFRALIRGDGILVDQTGAVKHYIGAST